MTLDGCLCDAPAVMGLQSLCCGQPMIATAMAFIGFSLQSIYIPPFNAEPSRLTAFGYDYACGSLRKEELFHHLVLVHSSCEVNRSK